MPWRAPPLGRSPWALAACREVGIFVCYNLLLFEPDAVLDDIEQNVGFVRAHADHPFNFGRAEPYIGTPLQTRLAADANLSGTYLGHGYRIKDDRTELLFRICSAAFRQRNYDADGVHNRYMGLGYVARLLEYFHNHGHGHGHGRGQPAGIAEIASDARALTRRITLESVGFLEEALLFVRAVDLVDRDRIERETALLGLRIAEADRWQHARLDQFFRDARRLAERPARSPAARTSGRVARIAQGMALGTLIAAAVQGCDDGRMVIDPDAGPLDYMVVDPDAGPLDYMVVDPDAGPLDYMVVDPDAGPLDAAPADAGVEGPVDPDVGPLDSSTAPDGKGPMDGSSGEQASAQGLIDRWQDPALENVTRTVDLPLFNPPVVRIAASRGPDRCIHLRLIGGPRAIRTRWEGDGRIEGGAREVRWFPDDEADQIRVGARTRGGIAVVALRARDIAEPDAT